MEKQLEISLLGGVNLKLDGQPVAEVTSQKAIALFVYLACNQRPISRDALATLFYGHLPQTRARANLRVLLSRLRPLNDYLLISRQTISFNVESNYRLDTAELSAQLNAVEQSETLSFEAATCLERALSLYKGDFLAGFHLPDALDFEEWAVVEQERLHRLGVEAMMRLLDFYLENGRYARGIELALRLLQLDAWNEEAHRQMMTLLARSGQRSAALAHYARCKQVLAQELGAEPAAETKALFQRIQTLELDAQERARQTTGVYPHNFPRQLTPFFGREMEIAQIVECAANPDCHLLSILGPGGVGKTRLALEAAQVLLQLAGQGQFFAHGLFFTPLASVSSGEFVASAIAETLNFSFYGPDSPQEQLINYLRQKEILLILDNFEHLLDAGDLLLEILQNAPQVKLVITSRERLNLRAEWLLPLEGLPYQSPGSAQPPPALRLFAQSAQRVSPQFSFDAERDAVIKICRQLEGLPLAIELAAASTRSNTCQQIARQIERSFDFLSVTWRDVPSRHRSLRAVFEHSWNLLTQAERAVFQQLSLFRGGFFQPAAQATAGASPAMLAALVDKSLLRVDAQQRYYAHQLLRQYAAEKLSQQPEVEESAFIQYSVYYANFLQERAPALKGPGQAAAIAEIGLEIDNVRRIWNRAAQQAEAGKRADLALKTLRRAAESLFLFYLLRDWHQEGRDAFNRAAAALQPSSSRREQRERKRLRAELLAYQARFCQFTAYSEQAQPLFEQSLSIFEELDDAAARAFSLHGLGYAAHTAGNYRQAKAYFLQSLQLYETRDDAWGTANALNGLSLVMRRQGKFQQAEAYARRSLNITRSMGEQRGIATSHNNLGLIYCAIGKYAQARTTLQEGLKISRRLNYQVGIANAYTGLCQAAFRLSEATQAEKFGRQSLNIYQEIGDYWGAAIALNNLGQMAMELGQYAKAQKLYAEGIAIYRRIGIKSGLANSLGGLGKARCHLNDFEGAKQALAEALQLALDIQTRPIALDILLTVAVLWQKEGRARQSLELLAFIKESSANLDAVREEAAALFADYARNLPAQIVTAAEAQSPKQVFDDVTATVLTALF